MPCLNEYLRSPSAPSAAFLRRVAVRHLEPHLAQWCAPLIGNARVSLDECGTRAAAAAAAAAAAEASRRQRLHVCRRAGLQWSRSAHPLDSVLGAIRCALEGSSKARYIRTQLLQIRTKCVTAMPPLSSTYVTLSAS
jgi:hypothetical protein